MWFDSRCVPPSFSGRSNIPRGFGTAPRKSRKSFAITRRKQKVFPVPARFSYEIKKRNRWVPRCFWCSSPSYYSPSVGGRSTSIVFDGILRRFGCRSYLVDGGGCLFEGPSAGGGDDRILRGGRGGDGGNVIHLQLSKYRRFGPHHCSKCGSALELLDEKADDAKLTPVQRLEEKLGAVDYDVWYCPACLNTDTQQYISYFSGFKECPACHPHTFKEAPKSDSSRDHHDGRIGRSRRTLRLVQETTSHDLSPRDFHLKRFRGK